MNIKLFSLIAFTFSSMAFATTNYQIDGSHTIVGFKIRHILSNQGGRFNDVTGSFNFDDKTSELKDISVKIKVASVNTENQKRDDHLRGADFFDVANHPEMTFTSKKVTKDGKDKYKVEGDLSLHGVTKPVTLNVEYRGKAKSPWGQDVIAFGATGKLNRKDFGIVWNKALDAGSMLLGDEVSLEIETEANPPAAAAK